MSSKIKKKIAIILIGLLMILTLLRENLFLEINAILNGEIVNRANFYLFYDYLSSYSLQKLNLIKFIATNLFIILFMSLTYLTISCWFSNKKFNKITLVIVSIFLLVLVSIFFLVKILGYYDESYFVLRRMIGLLQSPLPLFIFICLYMYLDKNKIQ